ncbi:MAG: hypothetical protein AAF604_11730 [Acidobacteriota bacterium]
MSPAKARKPRNSKPSRPSKKPAASTEADPLANAFHPRFLAWINDLELPHTSGEAAHRGPWKVEPSAHGTWAVLRQAESLAAGDPPRLELQDRQDALLAAAALPALGRGDSYALAERQEAEQKKAGADPIGYRLLRSGQAAGHCRHFDRELIEYLHALRTLCLYPEALAHLLEAAGHEGLVQAGRILAAQVGAGEE